MLAVNTNASGTIKSTVRVELNKLLENPDAFNCTPYPPMYKHSGTLTHWYVACFRKDQFRAGITQAKINAIKQKVSNTPKVKLQFSGNPQKTLADFGMHEVDQ
jgi:hypothetical protein